MHIRELNQNQLDFLIKTLLLRDTKRVGDVTLRIFLESHLTSSDSTEVTAQLFNKFKLSDRLEVIQRGIDSMAASGVGVLFYTSEKYPVYLKQIPDAPPIIFYKGDIDLVKLSKSIAVVGTRKASQFGLELTKDFVKQLVSKGFSIVSGLAFGIDKQAHVTTVENNGYAVAVLATSPDKCSPAANSKLYKDILLSGGVIFSENAPWDEVGPFSFAKRNRVVAGLSQSLLFVEGSRDSGAVITANLAFDYSRDVYAIVDRPFADSGANMLIRDNKARLVDNPEQLMLDLSVNESASSNSTEEINTKIVHDDDQFLLEFISNEGTDFDDLHRISKLEVGELLSKLIRLELVGIVKKRENKYYIK